VTLAIPALRGEGFSTASMSSSHIGSSSPKNFGRSIVNSTSSGANERPVHNRCAPGTSRLEWTAAGARNGRHGAGLRTSARNGTVVATMRIVLKPWGREVIFAETDQYVGKLLYISAGHRLSRQYHRTKDETVFVQSGQLEVELCDAGVSSVVRLLPSESLRIAPGVIHRMIGITDVELVEVSTPQLDDVVRIADDYGREGTSEA